MQERRFPWGNASFVAFLRLWSLDFSSVDLKLFHVLVKSRASVVWKLHRDGVQKKNESPEKPSIDPPQHGSFRARSLRSDS